MLEGILGLSNFYSLIQAQRKWTYSNILKSWFF